MTFTAQHFQAIDGLIDRAATLSALRLIGEAIAAEAEQWPADELAITRTVYSMRQERLQFPDRKAVSDEPG